MDIQQDIRGRLHLILFGALSIAAGIFGMPAAVALRIGANVLGAAYTVICNKVTDKVAEYIGTNKCAENLS